MLIEEETRSTSGNWKSQFLIHLLTPGAAINSGAQSERSVVAVIPPADVPPET